MNKETTEKHKLDMQTQKDTSAENIDTDTEISQKNNLRNELGSLIGKPRIFTVFAVILSVPLFAVVLLQAQFTFIGHKPKFCYVSTGNLECKSTDGRYHARYLLPRPDNRELTSLTSSPSQNYYLAQSSNISGLTQDTPTLWLLDKKLNVIKEIDLKQDPSNKFQRLFVICCNLVA